MIKFLMFVLFFSLSFASFGQFVPGEGEDKIEVQPNIAPKRAIVKVSLLSPLELARSIRVSAEVTLNSHFSLEPEIGYIYAFNTGTNRLDPKMLNAEQRLSLRYYLPQNVLNGIYVAPQVAFSSVNYQKGTWRNLVPNQPDSTWFIDYSNAGNYDQINFETYATIGLQTALFKHCVIDFCGGFGMHMQTTITKFSPMIGKGEPVPSPVTTIVSEGLFSVHLGYIF